MIEKQVSSSEFAKEIRKSSVRMVHRAKSSHIGSCFSIADIVAVLYSGYLRVRPDEPFWPERDRFILSKGHACAVVYAALAEKGFISKGDLEEYAQEGSRLMAHISHKVPGVEFSTGSLGHGLPYGVGAALSAKLSGEKWRTFILVGDGELDEGSNWEAMLFSSHHKLQNLTVIVDVNHLQSLTTTTETLDLGSLRDKFLAFGASVIEIDGHNHEQILKALNRATTELERPTVVLANTVKGKGVDYMENQISWHYKSPNDEELKEALLQIERMS